MVTYRVSLMDGVQLLGSEGEDLLDIISCLCRGLEEGINLILLLELNSSVPCDLTARE